MTFLQIPHSIALLTAGTLLLAPLQVTAQKSPLNKKAQDLAKAIKPNHPAKSANSKSIGALQKQMISAIQILEETERTNGPDPRDLISKALHFRPDIGSIEKVVLTNTLIDTWEEAHAMGLFDERGKFTPVISRGRGVGDKVVFEYIVPSEIYPPASNQLANVRLVPADERRVDGDSLTDWEVAKARQLKALVEERFESKEIADFRKGPKVNELGQTEKEVLDRWNAAMKEAGDIAHQQPKVRIQANLTATPSHQSKDRWRLSGEITNVSSHPSDMKARIWLIGYTEKKRQYFVMTDQTIDLKMRSGEIREFETYSQSRGSYKNKADDLDGLDKKERKGTRVRYRGFLIRVDHATGMVDYIASDAKLAGYLDPKDEDSDLGDLPKF